MFSVKSSSVNLSSFWLGIDVLLTKPHVVNKRLWGSRILSRFLCKHDKDTTCWPTKTGRLSDSYNFTEYVKTVITVHDYHEVSSGDNEAIVELVILELLPRNFNENRAYQLVYLYKSKGIVIFCDITPREHMQSLCPEFTFKIFLDSSNSIVLESNIESSNNSKAWKWLKETMFPQFVKWCSDLNGNTGNKQLCNDSLMLVSKNKYYTRYNELKLKYGKDMVKIWPECTDPSKFVYEDIAIATYILLLWEDLSTDGNKQSFIDLGCGNGLLVYILTKEGHKGSGLDVRKRHIWSLYPKDVILEEKTIVPSDTCLFPGTDWIIGNHSDELTPWIPIIAARSSYSCNFFLLPCCAYNFDGSKYQRQNSSKSQYSEYLEYVKNISDECGFITHVDRLKIPSTKRICLVGKGRVYSQEQQESNYKKNKVIIERSTNATSSNNSPGEWINNCKIRETVERVRNCTQIDKSIINKIVECIAKYLLEGRSQVEWNAGKIVEINDLVKLIPQNQLNCLKSECGGLATLLKNNHHIFKVQSGKVQFRYPKSVAEVSNMPLNKRNKVKLKIKHRPCWFHNNHPQGCPLSSEDCSFLHS